METFEIALGVLFIIGAGWLWFGRRWLRRRMRVSNLKKQLTPEYRFNGGRSRKFEELLADSQRIIPFGVSDSSRRTIKVVNRIELSTGVTGGHPISFIDFSYRLHHENYNEESVLFLAGRHWPDLFIEPIQPERHSLRMDSGQQPLLSSERHRLYLGANATISRQRAEQILEFVDQLPRQVAIERTASGLLINPQVPLEPFLLISLFPIPGIEFFTPQTAFRLPAAEVGSWLSWARQLDEIKEPTPQPVVAAVAVEPPHAEQYAEQHVEEVEVEVVNNDLGERLKGPAANNKLPYTTMEFIGLAFGLAVVIVGCLVNSFLIRMGGEWTEKWIGKWNAPFEYISGFIVGCIGVIIGAVASGSLAPVFSKFLHRKSGQWKRKLETLPMPTDLGGCLLGIFVGGAVGVAAVHFLARPVATFVVSIGVPVLFVVLILFGLSLRYANNKVTGR